MDLKILHEIKDDLDRILYNISDLQGIFLKHEAELPEVLSNLYDVLADIEPKILMEYRKAQYAYDEEDTIPDNPTHNSSTDMSM